MKILTFLLLLALAGCGGGDPPPTSLNCAEVRSPTSSAFSFSALAKDARVIDALFSSPSNKALTTVSATVTVSLPAATMGTRYAGGWFIVQIDKAEASVQRFTIEANLGKGDVSQVVSLTSSPLVLAQGAHEALLSFRLDSQAAADWPNNVKAGSLQVAVCPSA